ncbi:MAG: hypothetical protein HYY50_01490 [Candidatus Kerfeldbacteria bacterium]|nr:hypothetical protein [Candidatus Kerfeldbacteria bacterium]
MARPRLNPKVTKPTSDHRYHERVLAFSVLLSLVLLVGIGIYLKTKSPSKAPRRVVTPAVAVTPAHFTDFYGYVRGLDSDGLDVAATVTSPSGERLTRVYQVATNDQTAISQLDAAAGQPSASQVDWSEFKVGDLVQVFGPTEINLATVTSFTATRITKVTGS